jgi:tetratricopeptide (TPR) repeat protein
MLERIKSMELAGQWAEIRSMALELIEQAQPSDLARVHLSISTAYFQTAAGADDLRQSLAHVRLGLSLSTPGSLDHAWALGKLATLLVDMGRQDQVGPYAVAYLKIARAHPKLAVFTPYVHRALGKVAYNDRKFREAIPHHLKALAMFSAQGAEDQTARSMLNLVWSLARAGRPGNARTYLPASVPAHMEHLRNGAEAAILASEGRWTEAQTAGRLALRGARLAYDNADAAEVCLILAQAAARLGSVSDAFAYIREAASFAARQDQSLLALAVLSLRAEGGETPYAAASCGSGGWHPDARFTTGLA